MLLEELGWDEFFKERFSCYAAEGYTAARVTAQFKGSYKVYTEYGELSAGVSGSMRHKAAGIDSFPTVGDWVAVNIRLQEKSAVICGMLQRKSKFSRKTPGAETQEQLMAANVDIVFLVMSLNNNFNLRRLERYLISAWEGGANPVIVLSKSDLCDDIDELKSQVDTIAFGVPVHTVSCMTGEGIDELKKYIYNGRTAVLMGSSGVGKSTLINALAGEEILKTGEIREEDGRGRHTTTNRQMIMLPQGGVIIDTPGMRELQLWDASSGMSDTFEDIKELSAKCRFNDCRHEKEPSCAVNQAVSDGIISGERLLSYKKLQREIKYMEHKQVQAEKLRSKGDKKSISQSLVKFIEYSDL